MTETIKTPYGTVELTIEPQLVTYKRKVGNVIAQGPFIRALKRAERKFYVLTTPKWKRAPGRVRPIKITGVGYRSFEYQYALWMSNKKRYADPFKSLHVKGLAIDVNQNIDDLDKAEKALRSVGFKDGAAFGDPPHWSYPIAG